MHRISRLSSCLVQDANVVPLASPLVGVTFDFVIFDISVCYFPGFCIFLL